ncbi:MAG: peptidoglycan DD-metalloendopeptidase family protein [Anaerolineae bacterium]|nr:peptidoglycan DD-metalloendopeptidase family protein [Anaerolineae bacterium]
MGQQFDPYEPMPEHLADTGPIRRVQEVAGWRRVVGLLSLIGAAGLTIATALLLLTPSSSPEPLPPAATLQPTHTSEVVVPTTTPQENPVVQQPGLIPATLSPDALAALLATPVVPLAQTAGVEISRDDFSAFTIIPDRPRSQVIQYEVQPGDTIFALAERFGLKPESIAWANDRYIVEGLRVGRLINILPVDGAYFTVISEKSIADIARDYRVDPYVIIDSEYNDLFGKTPDDVLPSGTKVVIPGGTQEQINWSPPVERVSGSSSSSGVGKISFGAGESGSCGLVDNPGGGGGWIKPLASYVWVRGFSSFHSGVDLSAPIGTPVMAANGGTVVFSGMSSYGYGWTVVLAHGPYTTLYGHMSDIYARCGTYVNAGQVIGAVGSSGNSSGPHLHFEIRYNDIPTDPTGTMPF